MLQQGAYPPYNPTERDPIRYRARADNAAVAKERSLMSGNTTTVDTSSYVRDSLTFHIGQLGRQALERAFGDHQLVAMYAGWLEDTPFEDSAADPAMPCAILLEFGLSNGGHGTLYAYRRTPEFELTCEHERFSFSAQLTYDPDLQRLDGLFITHFEGDPLHALQWVHTATVEVGRACFDGHDPEQVKSLVN